MSIEFSSPEVCWLDESNSNKVISGNSFQRPPITVGDATFVFRYNISAAPDNRTSVRVLPNQHTRFQNVRDTMFELAQRGIGILPEVTVVDCDGNPIRDSLAYYEREGLAGVSNGVLDNIRAMHGPSFNTGLFDRIPAQRFSRGEISVIVDSALQQPDLAARVEAVFPSREY